MAKKIRKRPQRKSGPTNWTLIAGIVGLGVVGVFALLFASLAGGSGPGSSSASRENNFLANYCESNPGNCIERGSPDAPVTVVEVSDYGCGSCRDFNQRSVPALEAQYIETGKVRWFVMPFAISSQSGMLTLPSAVSAFCANEQGRFFDYHASIFALQTSPDFNSESGFSEVASELNMDLDEFSSCLADNDYGDVIVRNVQAAQAARLAKTPTLFINGRRLEGSYPNLSSYQQVIDAELGS